jgi:hypothetical protein
MSCEPVRPSEYTYPTVSHRRLLTRSRSSIRNKSRSTSSSTSRIRFGSVIRLRVSPSPRSITSRSSPGSIPNRVFPPSPGSHNAFFPHPSCKPAQTCPFQACVRAGSLAKAPAKAPPVRAFRVQVRSGSIQHDPQHPNTPTPPAHKRAANRIPAWGRKACAWLCNLERCAACATMVTRG